MEPLQPRPLVVLRKTVSSTSLASKEDSTDSARFSRKFGKHIQKRQLDIPEYAASFVDYKALKKVPLLATFSANTKLTFCSLSRSSVPRLLFPHLATMAMERNHWIRRHPFRRTRPLSSSEWYAF